MPLAAPPSPAAPSPVAPAPADAATAEARVDATVRRILQADDVPAFSRAMRDVMAVVGRDEASAQQLANMVLRDYALTVKVIRAANAAHFNRTGRPVQSATHALMLLGARTVRELAAGVLLFEHYRRRSPGLKELMLLSLLTASHARSAAEAVGGADPETAHLCGMFRSLGEVLVAAHLPDAYAAVLRGVAERTAAAARAGERPPTASALRASCATAVLGGPFEEVGVAVARHWGLPDAVSLGMRATGAAGEGRAATLTAFAHALTGAVYCEDPAWAAAASDAVVSAQGARAGLSRAQCRAVADRAVADTRELFAAVGLRLDDLRLTRQVALALADAPDEAAPARAHPAAPGAADVPPNGSPNAQPNMSPAAPADAVPDAAPAPAALATTPPAGNAPVEPPAPALPETRVRLTAELGAAAGDAAAFDAARVVLMALEAVLRGGPFDRAALHAADAGSGEFRPRTALGEAAEALLGGAGIPFAASAGPAGPALLRGEEVHLTHGTRLTLAEARLLRGWDAVSAVLVPVRVGGAVIGCVRADRRTAFAAPDAAALAHLRAVARALGRAFEVRRAAAQASRPTPLSTPALTPVRATPAPRPAAAAGVDPQAKVAAVLRVLRGEAAAGVAAELGVDAAALGAWQADFLAGAAARLGGSA